MTNTYHLAQLNVARLRFPLEDPRIQDFVDALDPVNALADASPGFIWRLQDDAGDATKFRIDQDDALLVNLSVWESLEALKQFVTDGPHLEIMRRRSEWFERASSAYLVLWWVPAGHTPAINEAAQRLDALRQDGSTALAFSFADPHPPPES